MTRQRAIQRLFRLWCIGGAILTVVVAAQVIADKYGSDDAAAWNWLLSIVVPPLSILGAAAFVDPRAAWRDANADGFKYGTAWWSSMAILGAALLILLVEPIPSVTSFELLTRTGVALTLMQGVLVTSIGAVVFDRR